MRRDLTTAVLIVVAAAGCGERASQSPTAATVTDSAGTTIVDNGVLDDNVSLLASTTPQLQIGLVDGPPEFQFFRVSDVKRLGDGGIAVANAGSRELRIYDADGGHRATAGGAGRGPGEFRYPSALVRGPGDTLQVQDFLDRVYFTSDGGFVRRETTDRGAFSALWSASGGMSEGGQWLGDGKLFAPVYRRDRSPPVAGPPYRPSVLLARVSGDFSTIDTLGEFGGILQQYVDVGGDRGVSGTVPPFATRTTWALGSSDGTVVAGDNASAQVERFLPDGSHMIVRWSAEDRETSSSEVEAWKDLQRGAEWAQDQLPTLERAWAEMDVPERKPYYGGVTAGSDGTLWVETGDHPAEETSLRAFSTEGRYLGRVDLPGRFIPHDSGPNWLLGVYRDAQEVEFIQMFVLNR